MKNFVKLLLLTALMITFTSISVWSEEEKPTASADVAALTKYVWRGFELSDESIVLQPSATIGYKGFSFNLWGNLDTDVDDGTNDNQFNETDWALSYATSTGPVSLDAGYIYYALDAVNDSEELYLSIDIDTILSPSITIYREISHLPSWYFSFGLSHSINLPKDITLDLAGSIGAYYSDDDDFTEFDSDDEYRDFHDGLISIGLTIPLDKYFTISPTIAYSFPLTDEADDLLTDASFSNNSEHFFGGVTLSLAF